jgi:OOP family OmpA-OmpF porin
MSAFRYLVLGIFLSLAAPAIQAQEPHAIKSIYFGGGSYYIDEEQSVSLSEFLQKHLETGQYEITIHSHTDNIGGAAYNEWLSEMRGLAVTDELVKNFIDAESIKVKDFGQFNPVYDNSTWEGRFRNRRVDIILWPIVL